MPLIQVFTSAGAPPDAGRALLTDLSALLAKRFGKPEKWVMTCLVADQAMTFSGTLARINAALDGIPMRELIERYAGGVRGGQERGEDDSG